MTRTHDELRSELDEVKTKCVGYKSLLDESMDRVAELKEQNKTLKSVLSWYGNALHYRATYGVAIAVMDSGDLARKTLKKVE